jgi:hypothetical protein
MNENALGYSEFYSFEFDRYLFEHPGFAEKIPNNAVVVLLPEYDPKLRKYNLDIAKKIASLINRWYSLRLPHFGHKNLGWCGLD